MSRTACIVIHHGSREDTGRALRSLAAVRGCERVVLLAVDNDPQVGDDEPEEKAPQEMSVEWLRPSENLGYAGGCNLGIERGLALGCDRFWLLNNDVVVEPGALAALLDAAERTGAALVGSVVCEEPDRDRLWFAGGRVIEPWYVVGHHGKGRARADVPLPSEPFDTPFVNGCSMLLTPEAIEQLGRLDASFFLYGEDLELCLRARALGLRQVVAPDSVVYHRVSRAIGGSASPIREYYLARNGLETIRRHVSGRAVRAFAYGTRTGWHGFRAVRAAIASGGLAERLGWLVRAVRDFRAGRLGPAAHDPRTDGAGRAQDPRTDGAGGTQG